MAITLNDKQKIEQENIIFYNLRSMSSKESFYRDLK